MTVAVCPKCALPNTLSARTCSRCGAALKEGAGTPGNEGQETGYDADICKTGDIINGRYEVLSLVGRGGMGMVYKVRDTVLEEELALKVLLPYFVSDGQVVERFINEVRITRKIAHPNIVRVHDIGSMGDCLFISMEFVNGESLRAILDRIGPKGRLTVRQAVYIVSQLCIALKYAHRFTVHRDIKPDNIMITPNNHVKIMDFGISKLKDERFDTDSREVLGTPIYMAPEQLHHALNVDGRADIYSLGVLLYELLTGRPPVGMFRPASQVCDDVPSELDAIIMKCLEPDREKRYANATELREALRLLSESSHDGGISHGTPAPSSASDAFSHAPVPPSVTEALEAFMKEEHLRGGFAEQPRNAAQLSAAGSALDRNYQGASAPLLEEFAGLAPTPVPIATGRGPGFWAGHVKLFVVLIVLAGLVLAYYGMSIAGNDGSATVSGEQVPAADVIEGLVQSKMKAAGNLIDALQLAVKDCEHENSPANRGVLEELRTRFIADVEARVYANPFNMSKLNGASNDAVRVGQFDHDPSIRALAEQVNHEVAQFKFVLTSVDSTQGTASFRLNNAYSAEQTATVKVGDLLQGRFLVTTVGTKAVFLEDSHPRCAGRVLVARFMEPIGAE